jgi:hypothetical protein
MQMKLGISFAVLFGVAAQTVYAQGILIVQREGKDTNRIQIDKDHMRVESTSGGNPTIFMYDAPKQVARIVNVNDKTYREITKTDLEQLRSQLNGAMAQIQEQLKDMPPQQRQAFEQMLAARGAIPQSAAAPKTQFRKTGSDKVGQWSCTTYDGFRGTEKVSSVCTVDPKEFGVSGSDFEVTQQFQEFMKTMAPEAAERMFLFGKGEEQDFSGIPVRRTNYRNGSAESVTEVTEFRRETIPASSFDVPSGFRKEAFGGRGR